MKKVVLIEILSLILVVALGVFAFAYLDAGTYLSQLLHPASQTEYTPTEATAAPTEPTEAPTEAPKPTEPAVELPPSPEPVQAPRNLTPDAGWANVLNGHTLSARAWFVYDLDNDCFLVQSQPVTKVVYPASITKLFSAYVALRFLPANQEITVGGEVLLIDPDSSVADLMIGDVLTVEQLVAGMMLPSGNDATYVLATAVGRHLAGDPELSYQAAIDRFVDQMNKEAKRLGMVNSQFSTPDGIHSSSHHLCFEDLVTVSKLALESPVISRHVQNAVLTTNLTETRKLEWENSNLLLDPESKYYCSYTSGLKTGFTTAAGNCLLSSFTVEDRHLLVGVFGCAVPDNRFADTLLILADLFDVTIPDVPVSQIPLPGDSPSLPNKNP